MEKLKNKPFALVGFNANTSEPAKLKEAMTRERMNWRSFAGDRATHSAWNSPGTPAYYVLDGKGVIRHKWVGNPGEKAIDSALEKLIKEVEESGAPERR